MEVLLIGVVVALLVVAVAVVLRSRRTRALRVEPPLPAEPPRRVPLPPDALPDAGLAVPPEVEEVAPVVEEVAEKPSFRDRLTRARSALGGAVGSVLGRSKIDAASFDDLEEALLLADVGIGTTTALLDDLRRRVKSESIATSEQLIEALKSDLKKQLVSADRSLRGSAAAGSR